MPKWTIGIPCYDQPGTLWATITALQMMHPQQMRESEIVVVNDNPDSAAGKLIADNAPRCKGPDVVEVRCVPSRPSHGTYAARNRIFDEARGDFVLCMDSHVFVGLGGLAALFDHFDKNQTSKDLVSGPVFYSNLRDYGTHYKDGFRGGMWGKWGKDQRANALSPWDEPPGDDPFEIPGMGIGLFACRRESFPRFHEAFRGFGGGEFYIHEKNRQQGGRSVCLPALRWPHYFWKETKAFSSPWYDRVRNEVIGRQELGFSINEVREHFAEGDSPKLSREQWEWLLADPIGHEKPKCKGCGQKTAPAAPQVAPMAPQTQSARIPGIVPGQAETLESAFTAACYTASDINQHCQKLRELSQESDTVVELGFRRGVSTTALLAGQPKKLITVDLRTDSAFDRLKSLRGRTEFEFIQGDSREITIPECDLLFIDTRHTAEQLAAELSKHASKSRRWIAFHDTATYGERGEDGSPGLLVALREFLFQNPEWSIVHDSIENNGFTVISRDDRDKPKLPGVVELAKNLAKSVAGYVASGMQDRTPEQVRACAEACCLCSMRRGESCARCGCPIVDRARMASNDCPLGKWPKVSQ